MFEKYPDILSLSHLDNFHVLRDLGRFTRSTQVPEASMVGKKLVYSVEVRLFIPEHLGNRLHFLTTAKPFKRVKRVFVFFERRVDEAARVSGAQAAALIKIITGKNGGGFSGILALGTVNHYQKEENWRLRFAAIRTVK
jgi:hypothetical protein